MSQPPFSRQLHRAAIRIHEHLAGGLTANGLDVLPTSRWGNTVKLLEHHLLCRRLGWQAAGRTVALDLDYGLSRLSSELQGLRSQILHPQPLEKISSASSIAADLEALADEFEELRIDLKEKHLSVTTASIVLEDVNLGPFQIVLHWERISRGPAYEVVALQPNNASGHEGVTHPHVQDQALCEGIGAAAIRSALTGGRLLDFFVLVRQILETYNSGSPYISLDNWSGERDVCCEDCGYETSADDCCNCERCQRTVCDECRGTCDTCDRLLCSACRSDCSQCGTSFCDSCLTRVGTNNDPVCGTCLQEQEEETHEDESSESAAADAVCLGEAASAA